jgi:cytochrome c oxidase subunit 4
MPFSRGALALARAALPPLDAPLVMAHTEHSSHHIISLRTLLSVFGALVALTVITVLTAKFVDLGPLNVPLALAIAGTKMMLVVAFFMALRYDKPINALTFSVGGIFVVIFLVFTLFDTAFRGDMGNVSTMTVWEEERRSEELKKRDPDPSQLKVAPADYESEAAGAQSSESGDAATDGS